MESPELKAKNYLQETGKALPPGDCSECHYFNFPNRCTALSEEGMKRCRKNGYTAGMRSIYLKEK
ncbi:MAG: hypothetical protein RIR01_2324 [Bacteroidota bacterium]|jgi:hypothetical protein